ncbi:TPA: hypothetical protein HA265_00890 [Candidatus Woesearchaeota archaeon]|nr:hypothetical protein [Candidatus Woesearchaeota archaeon]
MKIMIIGGSETGLDLANLLGEEFDMTIMEKDEEKAKNIANKTQALVIHGDGTDVSVLDEAGLAKMDAIIATTREDSTNLMVCEIAKNENVKKIITIVNSPKNEELFTKAGVSSIVSVVGTNITAIKQALHRFGDENVLMQWGDMELIQESVSEKSPLVGRPPKIDGGIIAGVSRKGSISLPDDGPLEAGDVILVSVKTKEVLDVLRIIRGK